MSNAAITVENLGKAYRIGLKEEIPDTLVGAMTSWVKAPLKNFHRLRRLDTFAESAAGTATAPPDGEEVPSPSSPEDIIWALRDVSFEVQEGEVVGIIGRNGAGKSTLLKILSRITEPTTGRAVIRGRVSSLLEVGTGFHPELSGRENIYMNGTILGMSKREIDRKFDEIVDFAGVEKYLDTPIKRYSSGMKVRLAFSVAAHLEPEILIIDEVLAVGDVAFQRKCMGRMQDVARGGRTVLFVSHNMAAVEALCRTGIELEGGQIGVMGLINPVVSAYREKAYQQVGSGDGEEFCGTQFFQSISVVDHDGVPMAFLPLGSDCCFRIRLRESVRVESPKIGIGINDVLGHRMLTVHTPMSEHAIRTADGRSEIFCRIPNFPLAPGRYTVKVVLTDKRQELESIERAATLTVIDGNAFGEGRGHHRGVCVAPSEWWVSPQAREILA